MAKVVAYEVQVNGIKGVITNQNDLTAAVKATTKAYKDADFGSDERQQAEKELASLKNLQAQFRADVRQTARDQQIAADRGKESYRALNAELVNLRNQYKQLSRAEREVAGPGLLNRINQLDTELKEIDAAMGNYQRNVGNYANAFAELGGIDLASFATVPGAIVAIGSAAIQAGGALLEMTEDVRVLRGELQTLTGETGEELDALTARVLAIGETFDQVPNEVANAANAVAEQFGISFDEALARIEEGFVAGSNITGEFLDSLREYPAFFQEAGLGADALFRVINQTVTDGIFSDKGVDAIKEATIRLRELPTATRDALTAIGLDSQEIQRQIADEGIGAAIATVSERLGQLEADSPEVGEAIAGIFGGAGEDAGVNFLLSLQDINAETGSLIDTTNEYQQQQLKTLEVNREFAEVQTQIATQLGGTGVSFENLGTIIKTRALQFLILMIDNIKVMFAALQPLRDAFVRLGQSLGLVSEEGELTERTFNIISKVMEVAAIPIQLAGKALGFLVDSLADAVNAGAEFLEWLGILDPEARKAEERAARMAGANGRLGGSLREATTAQQDQEKATRDARDEVDKMESSIRRMSAATNAAAVATDAFAKDSVSALREEVNKLRGELDNASISDQQGILSKLLDAEQALQDVEDYRKSLRERLVEGKIEPISLLPPTEIQQLETEDYAQRIIDARKKANEEILEQQIDLSESIGEIQEGIFDGINTAIDSLSAASASRTQAEVRDLERRYEREIQLAEGNESRQEQLQEELAAKREEIERREFNQQKKFRRAAVAASFAEGIVNILSAPTTIPDPFGALYKALRVGILTATTATQLSIIDRQQAARGAKVRRPKGIKISRALAHGDIIGNVARGASHNDNSKGIDIMLNGQPFSVEHGEFLDYTEDGSIAVVNARSAAVFGDELQGMAGIAFPGKGRRLGQINSYKNFGVQYARDGALVQPASASLGVGSTARVQSSSVLVLSDASIRDLANSTGDAVERGARRGVSDGIQTASRQSDRQRRVNKRVKR